MNDVPIVSMNGILLPADEVKVSPFDLGLTVGLGVFETLLAYDGHLFGLEQHHRRMEKGWQEIVPTGTEMISVDTVRRSIDAVLHANGLTIGRARVRVSISGGENPLQGGGRLGNLMITAVEQAEPSLVAKLELSAFICNENSSVVGFKSASYADHLGTWRAALSHGADEAVRLNSQGFLCECAMSNIFLVKSSVVFTPSLNSGCLAGVTRELVIEICQEQQIEIIEADLTNHDLLEADEIFITSSAREIQAAVMMGEDEKLAHPVTLNIAAAYRRRVNHIN